MDSNEISYLWVYGNEVMELMLLRDQSNYYASPARIK